jgi:hypothetical protein
MAAAGQCAGQGNCQGACQAAAAAQSSLEEARRQLAARRAQARADLAGERLARLEDTLKHLRGVQQNILGETQRFAGLQGQGELSRPQTAGLRDLGRQQASLQAETDRLGGELAGAGAFQLTLSRAGRCMGRAAALLNRQQTGPPTEEAEKEALGHLDMLLSALKREPPAAAQSSGAGGAGGAGAGQGGRPGAVQLLAELKLLKLLQEALNLRTAELHKTVKAPDALTDEQQQQYAALSEEQGRLAELTSQLLEGQQENPEDKPAALPDLRDEEGRRLPNGEDIR